MCVKQKLISSYLIVLITFRVSRRRRENVLWSRASVSVRARMPTLLHGPGCNFGEWYGMPSCARLGAVHGLRCYSKITRTRNVSEYYMLVLAACVVDIAFVFY